MSRSSHVSTESLNGTNLRRTPLGLLDASSAGIESGAVLFLHRALYIPKAEMTLPKATRLLLMLAPSRKREVVQGRFPARSLPAKSTKVSLVSSNWTTKTEWLRLDRGLLGVAATRRCELPRLSRRRRLTESGAECQLSPGNCVTEQ